MSQSSRFLGVVIVGASSWPALKHLLLTGQVSAVIEEYELHREIARGSLGERY